MSEQKLGIFSCRGICWIVGALIGLVAALIINGVWGLIVGIVLAIALALILQRLFCQPASAAATTAATRSGVSTDAAATTGVAAAARPGMSTDPVAVAEAAAQERAAAEAAAREREEATAAEKAATEKAAAQKAAAEKAAAVAAEEKAAAEAAAREKAAADRATTAANENTPDYDGDGVREGTDEGTRPETLTAARGGKPDDLKLIKGVGPKLEQLCNEIGFYHWDQIASWSADEVAWVDANLKGFKGRVTRDNWVEQAKVLAAGGTTEFAERAEKTGLYDKE